MNYRDIGKNIALKKFRILHPLWMVPSNTMNFTLRICQAYLAPVSAGHGARQGRNSPFYFDTQGHASQRAHPASQLDGNTAFPGAVATVTWVKGEGAEPPDDRPSADALFLVTYGPILFRHWVGEAA